MTYVTTARGYARRLVETEARRSRLSQKAALTAVASRLRESPSTLWSLLYRSPKRVSADLLDTLHAAVEREIRREIGALENELADLARSPRRVDPRTIEAVEAGIRELRKSLCGAEHAR
jgi:septal ring factor EnvC (AmiA/AmiB activator)